MFLESSREITSNLKSLRSLYSFLLVIKQLRTLQTNSLLGYQLGYANLTDTKIHKQGMRIKFEKGTKKEGNETKVVKLTWSCLKLAI